MRTQPSRSFAWRRRRWRTLARLALGCVVMGFGATGAAHAVSERRHVDARTGMLEVPLEELVVAVRRKRRADAQGVQAALTGSATLPGRARLIGPVTELLNASDATVASAAARQRHD